MAAYVVRYKYLLVRVERAILIIFKFFLFISVVGAHRLMCLFFCYRINFAIDLPKACQMAGLRAIINNRELLKHNFGAFPFSPSFRK